MAEKKPVLLAQCVCGHPSNTHYADFDGISECADCECRSFHWNGGERVPPAPNRNYFTGEKEAVSSSTEQTTKDDGPVNGTNSGQPDVRP